MGLVQRFTNEEIKAEIAKRVALIDNAIIRRLSYLGEQCRNHAIDNRGYTDQTSNLKSSTGYLIVAHGEIVKSAFKKQDKANTGDLIGRTYAEQLATKYQSGYALVMVAGMTYASLVEARGRNVLGTTKQFCEQEMPQMIEQLKSNIKMMTR